MFKLKKLAKKFLTAGALVIAATMLPTAQAAVQNADDPVPVKEITKALQKMKHTVFPIGKPNVGYARYFTGKTYLAPLESGNGINVANVTFEPACINHWHIHHKSCQILVGMSGVGWYQIWGEEPQKMDPGVSVTIPEGVKHWHGAASDSWFQHFSIMLDGATTEWLEPVDQAEYAKLK